MSITKKFRCVSIVKLVLFSTVEILWCVAESRQENLIFIILASLLLLCNAIKIAFTAIDLKKITRIISLIVLWLAELIITTALLALLYYKTGFDLNDFPALFVTFVIATLFIAEVGLFVNFLKSEIKPEE